MVHKLFFLVVTDDRLADYSLSWLAEDPKPQVSLVPSAIPGPHQVDLAIKVCQSIGGVCSLPWSSLKHLVCLRVFQGLAGSINLLTPEQTSQLFIRGPGPQEFPH